MNFVKNRKGQGGDTFKLLIAAVVAMVILGIITGVFQNIWNMVFQITCVSSPMDELMTNINRAQSGMSATTGVICMAPREMLKSAQIISKVGSLSDFGFKCDGASVCDGTAKQIEVTTGSDGSISTDVSTKFRLNIDCPVHTSDGYECYATVMNPD